MAPYWLQLSFFWCGELNSEPQVCQAGSATEQHLQPCSFLENESTGCLTETSTIFLELRFLAVL